MKDKKGPKSLGIGLKEGLERPQEDKKRASRRKRRKAKPDWAPSEVVSQQIEPEIWQNCPQQNGKKAQVNRRGPTDAAGQTNPLANSLEELFADA